MTATAETYKRQAAERALEFVERGMILGLGTGSTANAFIALLAERMKNEDLRLRCVATSRATRMLAEQLKIGLSDFDSIPHLDLTVDGADEIDPDLNLIKGGGGALLYEKIVAMASDRVCIVAEASKRVSKLGKFPLPVEIVPFGLAATLSMIETAAEDAGCTGEVVLRLGADGMPFVTDGGHLIADCAFNMIPDVEILGDVFDIIPGVVEHGLFIGIADDVILAGEDGVRVLHQEYL